MGSTLNDKKFEYLGSLGYTGTLNDRERAWRVAEGYSSGSLYEVYKDAGYTGSINDMAYEFFSNRIPFIYDEYTYVWNFTSGITVDETGTDSISSCPCMVHGDDYAFTQGTKASQPVLDANGASFTAGTTEFMETATGFTPALNATAGVYMAAVLKPDAAATAVMAVLRAYRNANTVAGRVALEFATLKKPTLRGSPTDAASLPTYGLGDALTYGNWMVVEWRLGLNDDVELWIDGSPIVLTTNTPTATAAFPSTNSLGLLLGQTFHGVVKAISVYDGVISDEARQSMSDYLMSIKP